jgi:hypothetical protein
MCILLSFIHLLFKLLGFLFIREAKTGETIFQLKRVEEGAVLIVRKGVVNFLIPYDTSIGWRDVNHFDPHGVSDQIVGQHGSTLETGIGPLRTIRVCDVELRDGDGVNFVG